MPSPAPSLVFHIQNLNFERAAGGGALDIDGTRQRVNLAEIEICQVGGGRIGRDLPDWLGTFHHDRIAGVDFKTRRDGIVPEGLGDAVIQIMFGHFRFPVRLIILKQVGQVPAAVAASGNAVAGQASGILPR